MAPSSLCLLAASLVLSTWGISPAVAKPWWEGMSPLGFEMTRAVLANTGSTDMGNTRVSNREGRMLAGGPFPTAPGAATGDLKNYVNSLYYIQVQIGSSSNPLLNVQVDTGSTLLWFHCNTDNSEPKKGEYVLDRSTMIYCKGCDQPWVDPSGPFACSQGISPCRFSYKFGDGSNSTGLFINETLTIGSQSLGRVVMGCQTYGKDLQVHSGEIANGTDGIMGLGRTSSDYLGASVLTSLAASGAIPNSFSLCLTDGGDASDTNPDGILLLGSNYTYPNTQSADLIKDYFYFLPVVDIAIQGKKVNLDTTELNGNNTEYGVILDSGTAVTRFPQASLMVFKEVLDAQLLPLGFKAGLDNFYPLCYDFTGVTQENLDKFAVYVEILLVGGGSIQVPTTQLFLFTDPTTICASVSNITGGLIIIGDSWMRNNFFTFDIPSSKVYWTPVNCTNGEALALQSAPSPVSSPAPESSPITRAPGPLAPPPLSTTRAPGPTSSSPGHTFPLFAFPAAIIALALLF